MADINAPRECLYSETGEHAWERVPNIVYGASRCVYCPAKYVRLGSAQAEELYYVWQAEEPEGWKVDAKNNLVVQGGHLEEVIYVVTNQRDIATDNAEWSDVEHKPKFRSRAQSLQTLTDRLVEIAGGFDALSPQTQYWVKL